MNGILKTLYFLGVLAETAIRLPHERRRRQARIAVDHMDVSERALVGLVFVGMFLIPAIYALTPWLDRADYRLPQKAEVRAGGVGTVLMAVAVWLFWRSHVDLGHNWSPSLQLREGHTLVTKGVYHSVRHPMYVSMWLWGIAQAMLLQNWISGWASLMLFLPLYLLRVPHEEQMMLEHFGEAYRTYMDRAAADEPGYGYHSHRSKERSVKPALDLEVVW